jgi:DNA adenine methylase
VIQVPAPVRPLLKWAGGKRQLLPTLRRFYPPDFDRYVEPFTGSAAVFFDLHSSGQLQGRRARLADVNPDLIGCYRIVRDNADKVIEELEALADEHRDRGAECYYEVRDRRFNPTRTRLLPGELSMAGRYTPKLAAMLIYLNRTGFNGLFRLNRNGEFNVPAGRYTDPRICDADLVRSVARAMAADRVTLECLPFERILGEVGIGDFIYCDPPYAPLSKTATFANYTAAGFGRPDQLRLHAAVVGAAKRRAVVLLSNSSAPEIVAAYRSGPSRAAGLTLRFVPARRAINSQAARRGPVDEVLVTNASPPKLRMAKVISAQRRVAGARVPVAAARRTS